MSVSPVKGLSILLLVLMPGLVSGETIYTMGVVPQYDSRKIEEIWRPILKRVSDKTGVKIKLVGAPGIPAFEKQFEAGVFDFAYMNPYHVLISNKTRGYMPIARDVTRKLYGIVVVKKDSAIKGVEDLEDKVVAFPAPNAIGASMMVRADFSGKFHIKIRPKYVNSHDSVYLNVALGQAAAGGGVQKTFERQSDTIKDSLRVLYKTSSFSPHPIVAHPRVNKAVREKIRNAFLELGKSEPGRELMRKIPINQIGAASMQDYKSLSEMGLDDFYVK